MTRIQPQSVVPAVEKSSAQAANTPAVAEQDERYPGTFFRVPGVPKPGKTTWSLAK